jgi:4-hydroxyphenylacetate 3-monooxygenase
MGQEITDPSMVVMFIAPMNTPGIKLICRPSYEFAAAAATGSPWGYPLTSRFDENDAIFVFDNAFIPWENVVIYRDIERLKSFYPRSGFFNGFTFKVVPGLRAATSAKLPELLKRSDVAHPRGPSPSPIVSALLV